MSNAYSDILTLNNSINSETPRVVSSAKRWNYVLDQSGTSYSSSQSIIETSAIANSNWINYREAYLAVPIVITLTNANIGDASNGGAMIAPNVAATSCDWLVGMKNSYLSLIHSLSIEVNQRTLVQQTPLCALYNNFQLLTSLSMSDIIVEGSTIGFYPDNPLSYEYYATAGASGLGVTNNDITQSPWATVAQNNSFATSNEGLFKRISYINYDPDATTGPNGLGSSFATLQTASYADQLYRNRIFTKQDGALNTSYSVVQYQIMAIIKLRHLHSLFNNLPLAKNLQVKLILNLNQSQTLLSVDGSGNMTQTNEYLAFSGINPLMVASRRIGIAGTTTALVRNPSPVYGSLTEGAIRMSLYVGNKCLSSAQSSITGVANSKLPGSIALYAPAYDLIPATESLYISNPNKTIIYSDIYHYVIPKVSGGGSFKQLISNGIAGVKSVLIIPFYNADSTGTGYASTGVPPYQSLFDTAGGGTTSPLTSITNLQIYVGGVAMILNNTGRYNFELFNEYLYGCNSINAGLTDGLNSGLVDEQSFNHSHCYYYVDTSRSLPIEASIPKSVNIEGTNTSNFVIDYHVFVEFENKVSMNVVSGLLL